MQCSSIEIELFKRGRIPKSSSICALFMQSIGERFPFRSARRTNPCFPSSSFIHPRLLPAIQSQFTFEPARRHRSFPATIPPLSPLASPRYPSNYLRVISQQMFSHIRTSFHIFLVLLFTVRSVSAQFRFLPDLAPEATPQIDPLRKVFGIWGRLLNRMAQQNPPTDDELHLKEPSENGNAIVNEDPDPEAFPPRVNGFGGGSGKLSGPDRIIDENRLNAILPRLNPSMQKASSQSTTTSSSTTSPTTTTTSVTTTTASSVSTVDGMSSEGTSSTNEATATERTRRKQKKKKGRRTSAAPKSTTTTTATASTTTSTTTVPITTTTITPTTTTTTTEKSTTTSVKVPPMSILKEERREHQTKVGTTIQLKTSAENGEQLRVEQSIALNETTLAKMENETAQLIAEIENVLADAEMGPNGHWLRESAKNGSTEAPTKSAALAAEIEGTTTSAEPKEEEASGEDDDEEGEEDEEGEGEENDNDESSESSRDGEMTKNATTMTISTTTTMTTTTTTTTNVMAGVQGGLKPRGNGRFLPEAEEEEQAADISQLQLDPTSVSPPTAPPTSSSTQVPQSAQNIFNMNANANSNANPNFSNVIKPVNSIIDGIGPLILPLIGYSRQAFDSYSPFAAQRTEGVSIFRPGEWTPQAQRQHPQQQQQQLRYQPQSRPLIPIQTQQPQPSPLARPAPLPVIPPLIPRQLFTTEPVAPQKAMPDPPSLELLGRIIEQRKQKERQQRKELGQQLGPVQQVSGSAPSSDEQKYVPPNLSVGTKQLPEAVPARPVVAPSPETAQPDRGYDAGRVGVQSTFEEDSGLMLGGQRPQPKGGGGQGGGEAPPRGGSGFGGGRGPSEVPFLFSAKH